jgi:hypothetical protein
MMMLGAAKPLTSQEIEELGKIPEQLDNMLHSMTVLPGTLSIFGNNFMISLLGFLPFAGPVFNAYAAYNSGVISEAFMLRAHWQGPPFLLTLKLFVFPFCWMEFIAYSLAFSESIWLSWRIIKGKAKSELLKLLILVLVCAAILLAAAFIEMEILTM